MRNARENGIALITALLILLLVSSIAIGFAWLCMTDQALGGNSGDRQEAFYAAEAGMEKMTADVGNLFSVNYAPSGNDVNALVTNNFQPVLPGISYISPDGSSGYQIAFPTDARGNPAATNQTIHSGPYQGLIALLTPYTLTVTSRSLNNSEVRLQRTIQTVSIPVFQFGIFSQTDLSFFAGPNFSFGGRAHTNGNMWLAEGGGSTLTMSDRVTAVGEVIRTNLSNGWLTNTSGSYTGTVTIAKGANTFANLAANQGSLKGTLGSAWNEPTWTSTSLGTFNGYIRNGRTGAKPLNLTIALNTGAFPIDLVRRGLPSEDQPPPTGNPGVLGQRYYSEASLKILLSDNKTDITSLPCIDATTAPTDLTTLTSAQLGGVPLPLSAGPAAGNPYNPSLKGGDGYWYPAGTPLITGFIKIEVQTAYAVPPAACGTWKDVTAEILGLGVAARNLNPQGAYLAPPALPALPISTANRLGPSGCPDPSPNAVIRLERVRDNPSTSAPGGGCGALSVVPTDYWPLALFDTREGNPRDTVPGGSKTFSGTTVNYSSMPTLTGVMYYVELDVKNLTRWFTGAIGASGTSARDPNDSTLDFVVYFSDRRGNYTPAAVANTWPPASPSGHETGEYGFEDFINPANQFGCPDSVLNTGEGLDVVENPGIQQPGQTLLKYGETASPLLTGFLKGVNDGTGPAPAFTPNPNCAAPATIWPGWYMVSPQEARENMPQFFRRALKIRNGSAINLGLCPNAFNCGLTIASENPVYVQGDYNACSNGNFCDPHVASAIVGDAVTLLSNNWNDVNSFAFPYNTGGRIASTTTYRTATVSGKGISFPQPQGYATYQDFGTDGGVHNFLRYIENWGGQTLFYRGSIVSFYYNRQAVGVYKCCTTVYSPPTRGYNFDVEFLQPPLLPPRTPMFRDVNTIGFKQLIMPNQ